MNGKDEVIKILVSALNFYADEDKYIGEHGVFWGIVIDGGRTARKALKEVGFYEKDY